MKRFDITNWVGEEHLLKQFLQIFDSGVIPTDEEWELYHNVHDMDEFERRLMKSRGYAVALRHGEYELLEYLRYKIRPSKQLRFF